MIISKRTLVAGAAIAAVGMAGVGSVGLASAATDNAADGSTGTSIVDKIATKFNLNKDEVKAVFDEERNARHAEMKERQAERLAQAVTDGKLTQEQADHITAAMAEIEALMGNATPGEQSDETHEQIKAKMDALRTWAEANDVDMGEVGLMVRAKHEGRHGGAHFNVRLDDGAEDRLEDSSDDRPSNSSGANN
jgi:polyhydroxyalkanoate synthesis regulator phasin